MKKETLFKAYKENYKNRNLGVENLLRKPNDVDYDNYDNAYLGDDDNNYYGLEDIESNFQDNIEEFGNKEISFNDINIECKKLASIISDSKDEIKSRGFKLIKRLIDEFDGGKLDEGLKKYE